MKVNFVKSSMVMICNIKNVSIMFQDVVRINFTMNATVCQFFL